jgi:hypothetical protein
MDQASDSGLIEAQNTILSRNGRDRQGQGEKVKDRLGRRRKINNKKGTRVASRVPLHLFYFLFYFNGTAQPGVVRSAISEAALTNGFNTRAAESGRPPSTGSAGEPVPTNHFRLSRLTYEQPLVLHKNQGELLSSP